MSESVGLIILPEPKPAPVPKHSCDPPMDDDGLVYGVPEAYPLGTLWRCPKCFRWWHAYNGGLFDRWAKVRWYNVRLQRRIRRWEAGEISERLVRE